MNEIELNKEVIRLSMDVLGDTPMRGTDILRFMSDLRQTLIKKKKYCPCGSTIKSEDISDQEFCLSCGYGIINAKVGDKYIDEENINWFVVDVISLDSNYPQAWVIWVSENGGYKKRDQHQWDGGGWLEIKEDD